MVLKTAFQVFRIDLSDPEAAKKDPTCDVKPYIIKSSKIEETQPNRLSNLHEALINALIWYMCSLRSVKDKCLIKSWRRENVRQGFGTCMSKIVSLSPRSDRSDVVNNISEKDSWNKKNLLQSRNFNFLWNDHNIFYWMKYPANQMQTCMNCYCFPKTNRFHNADMIHQTPHQAGFGMWQIVFWQCCDRKGRSSHCVQQATIDITRRVHSIPACARQTHMVLFLAHIPLVVHSAGDADRPRDFNARKTKKLTEAFENINNRECFTFLELNNEIFSSGIRFQTTAIQKISLLCGVYWVKTAHELVTFRTYIASSAVPVSNPWHIWTTLQKERHFETTSGVFYANKAYFLL